MNQQDDKGIDTRNTNSTEPDPKSFNGDNTLEIAVSASVSVIILGVVAVLLFLYDRRRKGGSTNFIYFSN